MKKLLTIFLFLFLIKTFAQQPNEMRAVWITNVDSYVLFNDINIINAMDYLDSLNINVIFPVVWNKGYTLYPSKIMDSLFNTPIWPTFTGKDPLKKIILEAHRHGIEVIPWFEFGFSSSYSQNGGHIISKFPGWAAKNSNGNLVVKNGFDWMAGTNPEVQNFMISLITEVIDNYDVDGIQGDDRLPAMPYEGGYDSATVAIYKFEHNGANPPGNPGDQNWRQWRADKLTEFLSRMRDSIKTRGKDFILSVSPSPYPFGYNEYLQDSPKWLQQGLVDNIIPQLYRQDISSYSFELTKALSYIPPDKKDIFFPGILAKVGSYLISPDLLLKSISANRQNNVNGESFFFYEAFTADNGKLGDTLRATYYAEDALLPYRNGNNWRPKAEIVNEDENGAVLSGNWEKKPVQGFNPNVYWTSDTSEASIKYSFNIVNEGWYQLYVYIVPNSLFTKQARYIAFSASDSTEIILNQQDQKNNGWTKLVDVYLHKGKQKVLKLDNKYLESGKYLLADAAMLMINRKLSPNIIISSAENEKLMTKVIDKYSLRQNYPNPFNPVTTIEYSIPKESKVSINVYDILGRRVRTLFDEVLAAGSYSVRFNGNGLASGVYFYELKADNYSSIKKLLLMK